MFRMDVPALYLPHVSAPQVYAVEFLKHGAELFTHMAIPALVELLARVMRCEFEVALVAGRWVVPIHLWVVRAGAHHRGRLMILLYMILGHSTEKIQ